MNWVRFSYIAVLSLAGTLFLWSLPVVADSAFVDARCCVSEVKRDADGKIARRSDVLREFRKRYACPSTKRHVGACPGWYLDHPIPLACGGKDVVSNLQWLPGEIKTCAGNFCKDRWERKVYCAMGRNDS